MSAPDFEAQMVWAAVATSLTARRAALFLLDIDPEAHAGPDNDVVLLGHCYPVPAYADPSEVAHGIRVSHARRRAT